MATAARARLMSILRGSPGVVPLGFVIAVFLIWVYQDGGFAPLHWLPGGLFVLGLLAIYALTAPGRLTAGWPILVALGAFAVFAALSYASIAWSEVRADAWAGANLTLLYLAVFAIAVLRPWRAGPAAVLMGAMCVGVAGIALGVFLATTTSSDPVSSFVAGRLAVPVAYSNANAAMLLSSFIPALYLSSRRECAPLVRALMLASAGVLAELALMCQSRSSLVAFPVTMAIYFAYVPGRLRSLISMALVVVAVWLSTDRILAVFDALVAGEGVRASLVDARTAVLWSAVGLAVAGGVIGFIDRGVLVPRVVVRVGGVIAVVAVTATVALGAFAFANQYGNPADQAGEWWRSFAAGRTVQASGTPHLVSGLGSGRYDIWRVAVELFVDHPVLGAGVNQFGAPYLRERRRLDEPSYPHSLELRTLSQTGIVGSLLLLAALGAAVFAAVLSRFGGPPFSRGVSAAALVYVFYWLVHGSVDWFWEMPVLGASAFAFLGLAARLGESAEIDENVPAEPGPETARPPRRRSSVAVAVGCGVAAVALALPWIAARDVQTAVAGWRTDPSRSYELLNRAGTLSASAQPDIIAAVIAAQFGDTTTQKAALLRAHRRTPNDWYPAMELGAIAGREGRRADALEWLRRAKLLNPLEPVVDVVADGVRQGDPVSEAEIERILTERADLLRGKRQK